MIPLKGFSPLTNRDLLAAPCTPPNLIILLPLYVQHDLGGVIVIYIVGCSSLSLLAHAGMSALIFKPPLIQQKLLFDHCVLRSFSDTTLFHSSRAGTGHSHLHRPPPLAKSAFLSVSYTISICRDNMECTQCIHR